MARSAKDVLILEQRAQCWSMRRGWNTLWPSQAPTAPPRRGPPALKAFALGKTLIPGSLSCDSLKTFLKWRLKQFHDNGDTRFAGSGLLSGLPFLRDADA